MSSILAFKLPTNFLSHPGGESADYEWAVTGNYLVGDVGLEIDKDQCGVIGDLVESTKKDDADHWKHFVAVKGGKDDYVYLRARVKEGIDFNTHYKWSGGEEVSKDEPLRRKVKRSSTAMHEVRIVLQSDKTKVIDKMRVWIVWVELSYDYLTTTKNTNIGFDKTLTYFSNTSGITIPNLGISATNAFNQSIVWEGLIKPSAVIADPAQPNVDIPDLLGPISESGASHKWDMTREMQRKVLMDGFTPPQDRAGPYMCDYPSWTSDDKDANDEDNNPYDGERGTKNGAPTRKIFSFNNVVVRMNILQMLNQARFTDLKRNHIFREYARVKLGNKWYRCSDFGNWRSLFRLRYVNGQWTRPASTNVIDNKHDGF